jgi:hypothetical protein
MSILNQIGKTINNFVSNHPTKTIFILGFITGFIIKSIF